MENKNKNVAYCGLITVVPNDSSVTYNQSGGATTTCYEKTYRDSYQDKQSGSYGRVSQKESFSSGDYSNRGREGYKNEYKTSSTVRVGDKGGYTEYSKQEKVTRVDYGGGSGSSKGYKSNGGGGSKKYLY